MLGAAVGAAVMLLCAPASGSEVRSRLAEKAGEIKDRAEEWTNQAVEKATEWKDRAVATAQETLENASDKLKTEGYGSSAGRSRSHASV